MLTSGRTGIHALTAWLPSGLYWLEGDAVITCDLSRTSCEPRKLADLPGAAYLAIANRFPDAPVGTAPRKTLTLYVATRDAVWPVNE